jgi:hypothetical protein
MVRHDQENDEVFGKCDHMLQHAGKPVSITQSYSASLNKKHGDRVQTMRQCTRRWWLKLDAPGIQYLQNGII